MSDSGGTYDGPVAWLILARYADAIERGGASLKVSADHKNAPSVSYAIRFTLAPEQVASMVYDSDGDSLPQTAERLSVKWGEIAVDLGAADIRRIAAEDNLCVTCGAEPDVHCMPTHEGERASTGLWVHPERRRVDEGQDERNRAIVMRATKELVALDVLDANLRNVLLRRFELNTLDRERAPAEPVVEDDAPLPELPEWRPPSCICVSQARRGITRDGRICPVHAW